MTKSSTKIRLVFDQNILLLTIYSLKVIVYFFKVSKNYSVPFLIFNKHLIVWRSRQWHKLNNIYNISKVQGCKKYVCMY